MDLSRLSGVIRFLNERRTKPPGAKLESQRDRLFAVLDECARALRAANGSIWLIDAAGTVLTCCLGLRGEEKKLKGYKLRVGEGIAGFCARTGKPLVVNDVRKDPRHAPKADQLLNIKTTQILSCPLLAEGRILGAMNLLDRARGMSDPFGDEDLLIAHLFAGAVADELASAAPGQNALRKNASPRVAIEPPLNRMDTSPVFASAAMTEVADRIRTSKERNLLLTGETGVGKDRLAAWAHEVSRSSRGPFVAVNCAAIYDSLWESEMFGHARGAFTGSAGEKLGQVELAARGTLFLNEIGEMPLPMQAKLLGFLDTGEFRRLGDPRARRAKVRIIAATNRDLREAIAAGTFRKDLFYRIAQVHVQIPPLRERRADIAALSTYYLDHLAQEAGVDPPWIAQSATEYLLSQLWEGNVRALFSAVSSAFDRCIEAGADVLAREHFDPLEAEPAAPVTPEFALGGEADGASSPDAIAKIGWALIQAARQSGQPELAKPVSPLENDAAFLRSILEKTKTVSTGRWNISAAHRELTRLGAIRMSRRTLERRVKELLNVEI